MFWTILFIVFVVLYLMAQFMHGYNRMDQPSKVRKIAKMQEQELNLKNNESHLGTLKEYKELLDMDIITQEEFDNKKKEILG